jgi:hypothetical protein
MYDWCRTCVSMRFHVVETVARFAHIHPGMSKLFVIVRVNGSNSDTHAAETLAQALELAMPDDGDVIEFGFVQANDAGAARLMRPRKWMPTPESNE